MSSGATVEQRPEAWALGFVLLLPLAWLIAFWSLVVRARLRAGTWPVARHGNPFDGTYVDTTISPGALGLHHKIVWAGLIALELLVPVAVMLLLLSIVVRGMRQNASVVQCFVWSVMAALVTVIVDPGGFWDWFMD